MIFKDFVVGIFEDTNGTPSSKRLTGLFFAFLMGIAFIANLFWKFEIAQFIFDTASYIVLTCLGVTTLEHFAPRSITDVSNDRHDHKDDDVKPE